jgi:hypothetical protein
LAAGTVVIALVAARGRASWPVAGGAAALAAAVTGAVTGAVTARWRANG